MMREARSGGNVGQPQFVDIIGGEVPLDKVIVDRGPGALAVLLPFDAERGEPLVVVADLPRGAITHPLASSRGLIGQEAGAELGVIQVSVMQGISAVGLAQLISLLPASAGPVAVVDIGLAHPLMQRHLVDTEVLRDLRDRDTVLTGPGHGHHIDTERNSWG
nr:hypothetical protein [Corynebacterium senegalense]